MASVISKETLASHNIGKYNFKVISSTGAEEVQSIPQVEHPVKEVDSSALSNSSKESLIESLMQKTDDMSSNFIKLHMKLEEKEEEYAKSLEQAKEEAFAQGLEAGIAKAVDDADATLKESIEFFAASVIKLDESASEYKKGLDDVKSQLIEAALDISQEVIKVEISQSANEIAGVLSEELIQDLQGAANITLKVNPNTHGAISEKFAKIENIKVIYDAAISEGGVIVISDIGNIDSQINKRFQRVKRTALGE